jgi:hypothetical protein
LSEEHVTRAYSAKAKRDWKLVAILILIYLLTAVGLSPGGSTHLHTNNTQRNTNNNRKTQIITNVKEFYPGICLKTEEKARRNLGQNKKILSQVK